MIQVRNAQVLMQSMNTESYKAMNKEYSNPNDAWYYGHRYDLKSAKSMKGCFFSLAGIIIIVVILLLFSSCKSIQYVPVEKVVTEYKTNTVHDSVYLEVLKHDSVVIEKQGDTVFVNKWHTIYKDRWREIAQTDTFIKVDSVQVPYPVEKKLTKWQQVKMDAGGTAIGICFIVIIIILVGFIVKVRSRI